MMDEKKEIAIYEFTKYLELMKEQPLFQIGGISNEETQKFWKKSYLIWKKHFPYESTVDANKFIHKAVEIFKLPNQTTSNANETLTFFFDPQKNKQIDYIQFCAFLALFGPAKTALRKVGHFLNCPEEAKNKLFFSDVAELQDSVIKSLEINCFSFGSYQNEKNVYNNVNEDTSKPYLIDDEGNEYMSWQEFFDQNIPQK